MLFKDIKIGACFKHNGTNFVKKSSRTAYISKNRFFYFGLNETICNTVKVDNSYYGA